MTDIHDLLDAVSQGQPQTGVSVDDLVRQGRRHQRALLSGVAAATAGIAAAITLVATLPGAGSTRRPGNPAQSAPYSGAVTSDWAIPAAHLFGDGTMVGTYVETYHCATPAFTVVSQDTQRVVLSLKLGAEAPPAPQTCRPFPSAGTSDSATSFAGEVKATLQQPLGARTLVDAATGRDIPYTADKQAAEPSWLPPGWHDVTGVQPADLHTWDQGWSTSPIGSPYAELRLSQRYQTSATLPGTPNETVGVSPARLDVTTKTLTVTWFSQGRLYTLIDGPVLVCTTPVGGGEAVCSPAAANKSRVLTKAELLRIARSVTPR